jgi:hypothetical protein
LQKRKFEEAETETEFATQGEIAIGAVVIGEETLFVKEIPTAAKGSERHRDEEYELDDRANADGPAAGDETRSDAQTFKDAVSYQISDDDNSSIDTIQTEKQEDSRTYYLINGKVTLKMSPRRSRRKT